MEKLLINGSPKEGCTYTTLSEVSNALNRERIDADFFWVGNKPIGDWMEHVSDEQYGS